MICLHVGRWLLYLLYKYFDDTWNKFTYYHILLQVCYHLDVVSNQNIYFSNNCCKIENEVNKTQ